MRRTFIATEIVKARYSIDTTEEQEKRIKEIGYQKWLDEFEIAELVEESVHEQIIEYTDTVKIKGTYAK